MKTIKSTLFIIPLLVLINSPIFAFEVVKLKYKDQIYSLQYKKYKQPMVLNLDENTGNRDTPFNTLLSYFSVLRNMKEYDEFALYQRMSSGKQTPEPKDIPSFMADAQTVLSGNIMIFGEILFEDYHIYIYRFSKSIQRHSGLPIKKFNNIYFIVTDLALTSDIIREISSNEYDMEQLKTLYKVPVE